MGNQRNVKQLRGQLRQIVQEMKDTLISNELVLEMEKRLVGYTRQRLDAIDERQKDIQAFMVRNSSPAPIAEPEATPTQALDTQGNTEAKTE